MNGTVTGKWKRSSELFMNHVWPEFAGYCGNGRLQLIELVALDTLNLLDWYAGIDAFQIVNEMGVRGIASRVQWIAPNTKRWDSFTIRYELSMSGKPTEYQKRQEARKNGMGFIIPYFTCQAYFSKEDKLLSAAMIKTEELYAYIDSVGIDSIKSRANPEDGNLFKPVFWDKLKDLSSMLVYPHPKVAGLFQPDLF